MNNQQDLPRLVLYRRNCHSSQQNYLAYLSSTTQFNLVQFTSYSQIASSVIVNIPLQPVKGLCLQVYKQKVYTAVAFVTRIIIFEGTETYFQSSLKLDTNIVEFSNGFSCVDRYESGDLKGFVFITKNGHITIFNLQDKNRIFKKPSTQPTYCSQSICINYPNMYIGTNTGKVLHIKIEQNSQSYKQLKCYDTTSNLPIINLNYVKTHNQVFATTCQGELFLFSSNLESVSIVSVHRSLISRIMVNKNFLYTAGQDFILNKFEILGSRKLKLVSSESFTKLIALFMTINNKAFISFYEQPKIKQV